MPICKKTGTLYEFWEGGDSTSPEDFNDLCWYHFVRLRNNDSSDMDLGWLKAEFNHICYSSRQSLKITLGYND